MACRGQRALHEDHAYCSASRCGFLGRCWRDRRLRRNAAGSGPAGRARNSSEVGSMANKPRS
jgi:hypothetical protein